MWEEGYIGSLTPLSDTLAELGVKAEVEKVSLAEEVREEWDLDSVVERIDSTLSILDSLEDAGILSFLNHLSEILRELKSVVAVSRKWNVAEVTGKIKETLKPFRGRVLLVTLKKVSCTLVDMKAFLEEVGGYDWGGEECLEHLACLHGHLEKLKPANLLICLKDFHGFLEAQCQQLIWLAGHPLIEKNMGTPNLFTWLIITKTNLEFVLADGVFVEGMQALQEMLEEMGRVQAIDLRE